MDRSCAATVCLDTPRARPIASFERPRRTSRATSHSVGVSLASGAGASGTEMTT